MKLKKRNTIKLIALLATGLGFAATLLSDWANSKEQDEIIEEKVNEALSKRDEEEMEEES